jgi:hypothetical protein
LIIIIMLSEENKLWSSSLCCSPTSCHFISIQWVPNDIFLGVKRMEREAEHSQAFSECDEQYACSSIRLHDVVLN